LKKNDPCPSPNLLADHERGDVIEMPHFLSDVEVPAVHAKQLDLTLGESLLAASNL
jgi:hypothetical protein